MSEILKFIKRAFEKIEPVQILNPGIYHYQTSSGEPLNFRLHLRVEPDGNGLLIINAATVLHLNQTATEYAYHLVNQTQEDEAIQEIQQRYNVSIDQIKTDFSSLKAQIEALIDIPDLDPVTYLNIERQTPYTDKITAPYRLDCALTYNLPKDSPPESAPVKRVERELNTEEWKQIIAKSWEAGIPHIVFTGGEPTLRKDLSDLVAYSEELGQVTGILTDGLKLGDSSYLQTLLMAGLDHTMIILQPNISSSWESLANFSYWADTMEEDLFVAVHLTLTNDNQFDFLRLIEKLADAGVSALSISTNDLSLKERLMEAQEFIYSKDIELVWDIPVPYSPLNPIALELENEEQEYIPGAGVGWLYVEPDGDVLPGQGINIILGNLLTDDWAEIWKAAQNYTAARQSPKKKLTEEM